MNSTSADLGDPRPLRRDAQRNRERILAAAKELFADRGIGTSFDDVAAAADVGVGTVYRHYPSKDALLDELFEETIAELADYTEAALSNPDPWAAFSGFLELLAEGLAANRALEAIALHPHRGQERVTNASKRLAAPVREIVDRAKAAGALPPDFQPEDIRMIQTMLAAVIRETQTDAPDRWRRYLAIVLRGLLNDRPAPTDTA
jgi:AcrR family transcriptional regulator